MTELRILKSQRATLLIEWHDSMTDKHEAILWVNELEVEVDLVLTEILAILQVEGNKCFGTCKQAVNIDGCDLRRMLPGVLQLMHVRTQQIHIQKFL